MVEEAHFKLGLTLNYTMYLRQSVLSAVAFDSSAASEAAALLVNGTMPRSGKEPVVPRTKIGKMDCLFLVPIIAGISLLALCLQIFGPKIHKFVKQKWSARQGYEVVSSHEQDEPEAPPATRTYMPSEGLAKDFMKRIRNVGVIAWILDFLRLLTVITLLALSIYATVVAHAPAAHIHPGSPGKAIASSNENDDISALMKGKGRKNGKKHRKNRKANFDFVTQEWIEFGMTIFYAYTTVLCAVILGLKARSSIRRIISLHVTVILFCAWCIYAYRDLYPLFSSTLTPVDILHAPAWLTWTRLVLLTVGAAILPALKPQPGSYIPVFKTPSGFQHSGSNFDKTKAPKFLAEYIPAEGSRVEAHITLTFAQSADGKIAGAGGQQLALSGQESMLMTHWMRSMHQAIMVGVGTAVNDNPRLNVRFLPDAYQSETPRPIVLDPQLRLPPNARMLLALSDDDTPHAKAPWLLCQTLQDWDQDIRKRKAALEEAGARVIEVDMPEGRMDLSRLPAVLQSLELQSIMVEGGASVIRQFLETTHTSENGGIRPLAHSVIVTVAPVTVGSEGTGYGPGDGLSSIQSRYGKERHTEKLGKDTILVYKA